MYGSGIYHMGEVIDWGVKLNLVDKSGAWYAYKGEKIGQGKKNAVAYLEENPQATEEIEKALLDKLIAKPGKKNEAEPDAEAAEGGVAEVAEAK